MRTSQKIINGDRGKLPPNFSAPDLSIWAENFLSYRDFNFIGSIDGDKFKMIYLYLTDAMEQKSVVIDKLKLST